VWHTIFVLIYFLYVSYYGGDAIDYFNKAKKINFNDSIGNIGIILIINFLYEVFNFSILSVSVIFGITGAVGLLFFDSALQAAVSHKEKWLKIFATMIIFLPSVSFWTAGLGKEPLSFLSTCLSLWAALKLNKRLPFMIFSIMLMLAVRPHIAGIMLIALFLGVFFSNKIFLHKKIFIIILLIFSVIILVPFALNYSGMGTNLNIDSILSYIQLRQSYNMHGGGAIDISKMSLPEQLFAFMFRPFIFDIHSMFAAAAAFDNLILFVLFILGAWSMLKGMRSDLGENRVFMWAYTLTVWTVLAITTANLGIALRQKWMVAPILIFLFISVIGRRKLATSVNEPDSRSSRADSQPAPGGC
jgi:hypothetical protein